MSDKIMILALESKGFSNVGAVLQVCNATDNPSNAVEILLGIFEEPKLPTTSKVRSAVCTIVKFNPLESESRQVKYTYQERESKYVYYPKACNKDVLKVQIKESGKFFDKGVKEVTIGDTTLYSTSREGYTEMYLNDIGALGERTSSCSVDAWIKKSTK